MNRKKLSDLQRATDAVFQKNYQTLRPVIEAEARVQQQLASLNSQVAEVRRDSASAEGYQVTGTDILWNGWESATRRQLNTDLARLRAQKLAAIEQLRAAFGRQQAIRSISDQYRQEHQVAQARKLSNQQ